MPLSLDLGDNSAQIVGRTPWSARVPLDPLFAPQNQPHVIPERRARGPAADQGVRPTFYAERPIEEN